MKFFCLIFLIVTFTPANAFSIDANSRSTKGEKEKTQLMQNLRGNGLCFTPNKGQLADMDGKLCPDVLYKGEGNGADIYLRKTGISYVYSNAGEVMHDIDEQIEELEHSGNSDILTVQQKKQELMQQQNIKLHRVDMDFEGCLPAKASANENGKTTTTINEFELEGYQNFYYAHCPEGITNVRQYNKVTYKNIYNNIDIAFYGDKQNGIKYDLIVQPHADPNQITLHWKGAESIHINREGNLVIKTSVNEFTESIPKVYQNINGKIVDVPTKYVLTLSPSGRAGEGFINFSFSIFNSSFPLVIDPWATYYGGTDGDAGTGVTTDNTGNVYLSGYTWSTSLIASGGFQNVKAGNYDAFLVKFNAAGNRLWATYYGGSSTDYGFDVATDINGNVFVAGETVSNNGIGAGGFQNTFGGARDAFLVKFNSAGTRMWGTFYGGTGLDGYGRVAADGAGNVYLAGQTQSTIGIAMGGFQNTYVGGQDAFLVKFNSTGTRIWATYYGGSGIETWPSIAVDGLNNVYLGGYTASTTGIFSVGFQNTLAGGIDAFLVKFDAAGNRLWATYYGGPGNDWSTDIATDALNNIYLAGFTTSTSGIASGGFQNTISGGGAFGDAYLIKFNPSGSRLWGTYYGANDSEISYGVATDVNNNVYLLLEVEDVVSPNLTDACAYQSVFNGGSSTDPFSGANGKPEDQQIVKFKPTGEKICVTYMGGPGEDDTDNSFGGAIAINGTSLYIIGRTDGGYPVTPGAFQTTFSGPFNTCNGCGTYGGGDAFVASLCTNICEGKILALNFTATTNNICANVPVFFTPTIANSCDTAGYKFHWIFTGGNPATSDSASPMVSFASVGSHDVKLIVTTPCKKDSITQLNYITTTQCTTCNLTGHFTKGTASCLGCGCKQWIMVTATGGTSPYSYSWPDGYMNRYKNQLCPGTYTINVKDKNGCSVNINLTAP